ncbi:MAG: protein translocase subunit SecF [Agarilytica sp.]
MSEQKIINFMGQRKIAAAISALLIVISIASLAVNKLNFGLDFTGGTSVELRYKETADLEQIRSVIKEGGYPSAVVANFGTDRDVAIRIQANDPKLGDALVKLLRDASATEVELKRVSFVGSQVGSELRDDGGLGMLFALAVVMIYVAVRFQFKFSLGAVAALAHDVIIVLGIFSLMQFDFDLTVLAAILAVIGYSLNDTIVVSDRIRENFRKVRNSHPLEIINISLTETLGRTLITSLTTLLVLLALFFVGGEIIHNFAVALIIGVVVGTYSSIYVAANILLALKLSSEDLMEVEKEGEDHEEIEI